MSSTEKDRLRRQKVLQQLNSKLQSNPRVNLGITGSKVSLQANKEGVPIKQSKIPRSLSPSNSIPQHGYDSKICSTASTKMLSPTRTQIRPNPWELHNQEDKQIRPKLSATSPIDRMHVSFKGRADGSRGATHTTSSKKLTIVVHTTNGSATSAGSGYDGSHVKRIPSQKLLPKLGKSRPLLTRGRSAKTQNHTTSAVIREPMQGKASQISGRSQPVSKTKSVSVQERINQLRNRYLTHKYALIWCKRVYGRVPPWSARRYHQRCVLRKCLRLWYHDWWMLHREWKLNIRAECHNRYRLWILVWTAWTEYVIRARAKKMMSHKIERFSTLRCLRLAWSGWNKYVTRRRGKRARIEQASGWNMDKTKRYVWLRWKQATAVRKQLEEMDTVALHHWAYRVQKRAWLCWLYSYHEKLQLAQKSQAAAQWHANNVWKRSCRSWLVYVSHRRAKHHMRGLAVERHNTGLLVKGFTCWKMRYLTAKRIAEFKEVISDRGRQAILRRKIQTWKYYIDLKRHKSYQHELAVLCHTLTLKARTLHHLKSYTLSQQRQADNKVLAQQVYIRKRLMLCWLVWLRRCEHNEEIKIGPLSRRARAHYAQKLTLSVVKSWVQYTHQRRQRKTLYAAADTHYRETALPKYFSAMQEYVCISYYKQDLKETSSTFRRETLLSMVFYKWWRDSRLMQDIRMLERMAILHSEEVSKRKLLRLWQLRTRERLTHVAQEEVAMRHCYNRIIQKTFQKWKVQRQTRHKTATQIEGAIKWHGHRLIRGSWNAWSKYVARRRFSHSRMKVATHHYDKVTLVKIIQAWKVFHLQSKDKKGRKMIATNYHHNKLKQYFLRKWRASIEVAVEYRELYHQAVQHYKYTCLKKHCTMWRTNTELSIEQKLCENERVSQAMDHLLRTRVSRLFASWRGYSTACVEERMARDKAKHYHSTSVIGKCFTAWQNYHFKHLRKMLLQRQGVWFESTRLLTACYTRWRIKLMAQLVEKQKTTVSLWHWSVSLERKVLIAWLLYTSQRKRKAERYAQAMDRHRASLLHMGVTQWIKVGTQMKAQREEIAMKQQVKSSQAVLQCVRRCALRWRAVAKRRKNRQSLCVGDTLTRHSTLKHTLSHDLWSDLARKMHIPDSVPPSRPQPRRSHFSNTPSHSLANEALPRLPPLPHPPPIPYANKRLTSVPGVNEDVNPSNFSFLPSTCSEESVRSENKDTSNIQWRSPLQQTTERACGSFKSPFAHTSHSESPLVESEALSPEPFGRHSTLHDPLSDVPNSQSHDLLSDVTVQTEIVQMRDELKQFHDLKTRQRSLEEQISSAAEKDLKHNLIQLQRQLEATVQCIQKRETGVKDIAFKVSKLLSQYTDPENKSS